MKLGPFTDPDVRKAILWEHEHFNEMPLVQIPQMVLYVAGVVVQFAAHTGLSLNFAYNRLLSPFLTSKDSAADFFIAPKHLPIPFDLDRPVDIAQSNFEGTFTESQWHLRSWAWEWAWSEKNPQQLRINYFGPITNLLAALRMFLAHQLLRQGRGLLLHASAAKWNHHTHVFLGPSGAGKSTSAYHTPGVILSDETVALAFESHGDLIALGTPFGGEHFPSAEIGELPIFLFVEKSHRNLRKSLSTRNAMARLLSQVVLSPLAPLPLWDNAAGIMEIIIEKHLVEILEAKINGSFWEECLL